MPAALRQPPRAAVEQSFETFEFVVDGDAQRLKSPRRRMDPAAPAADHRLDQPAQFASGLERRAPPGRDDRARDPARGALLAVFDK